MTTSDADLTLEQAKAVLKKNNMDFEGWSDDTIFFYAMTALNKGNSKSPNKKKESQKSEREGSVTNIDSSQNKDGYTSYDQVPWYRKNWFAILCFCLFPLILLIMMLTGDVYYEKDGQLCVYSRNARYVVFLWLVVSYALNAGLG